MKKVFSVQCSVFSGEPQQFKVQSSRFKVQGSKFPAPVSATAFHSAFRIPHSAFLAFAAAFAASAPAQDSQPVRLPEVVVTATRLPVDAGQTAATISVITREQLDAQRITSLAEALERLPGLLVSPSGTPGQQTSVFSRGTKSNHTLLVVDGRRLPANLAGGYDYSNIALDNVERIEVVRTPSSALYGGEAIGGVINIITRTGRGLKSPEHQLTLEAGSFNSFRESVSSRGASGKFDYAVGASQFNANFPRDNNGYRLTTFRSAFGWEPSDDLYLDVKTSYYQTDAGLPGSLAFPSNTDHLKREAANISPSIAWQAGERFESRLTYTFDNQFQPSLFFGVTERLTLQAHQLDWQNTFRARDNWTLTAGVLMQDTAIERTSGGVTDIAQSQTITGSYLQSEWSPHERLHFINSVRYDHHSDVPPGFTWRQGVAWRAPVTETRLFGNVSRNFAAPTPQDLYFPGFNNTALRPETSFGWELGVEQPFLDKKLSLGATWFQNKLDQFIQFDPTPKPGFPFGQPVNLAKATTEGGEFTVRWTPATSFTSEWSYTYLTATDDRNNLRLLRQPRHLVGWNALYKPVEQLTLTSGVQWVLQREDISDTTFVRIDAEDFLVLRASASWQATKNLQFWVRGENLTDDRHEVVSGFPALRAAVHSGVKWSF